MLTITMDIHLTTVLVRLRTVVVMTNLALPLKGEKERITHQSIMESRMIWRQVIRKAAVLRSLLAPPQIKRKRE
jgi:hypothetical protein